MLIISSLVPKNSVDPSKIAICISKRLFVDCEPPSWWVARDSLGAQREAQWRDSKRGPQFSKREQDTKIAICISKRLFVDCEPPSWWVARDSLGAQREAQWRDSKRGPQFSKREQDTKIAICISKRLFVDCEPPSWWVARDSNPRPSRCKRDALAN